MRRPLLGSVRYPAQLPACQVFRSRFHWKPLRPPPSHLPLEFEHRASDSRPDRPPSSVPGVPPGPTANDATGRLDAERPGPPATPQGVGYDHPRPPPGACPASLSLHPARAPPIPSPGRQPRPPHGLPPIPHPRPVHPQHPHPSQPTVVAPSLNPTVAAIPPSRAANTRTRSVGWARPTPPDRAVASARTPDTSTVPTRGVRDEG